MVLSEIETESGQNDQKGFIQIFSRSYQDIRNPKAHTLTHDLTAAKAAQYLVFASLLARCVQDATAVVRKNLCEAKSRMVKNLKRFEKAWFPVS